MFTLYKVKTKLLCQFLIKPSLNSSWPRTKTLHRRGYLNSKASTSILPLLIFSIASLEWQRIDFLKGVDTIHYG